MTKLQDNEACCHRQHYEVGVIASTTPVLVVENRAAGIRAFAAINEGRGKALRYGANDPKTLARLIWIEGEFAELLGAAIRASGGIDLTEILTQALHMGDDGHSRQKAASALLMNALAPHMADVNTSVFRDCFRQDNQLISFSKSTRKINQTGGHSQRPIVHAFGDI